MKEFVNEELEILRSIKKEDIWVGSKYQIVKESSTTGKGNFGENLTNKLLNKLGIASEIINGGIGDFDILIRKKTKIEHKVATLDTHCSFQFNHIRKNSGYDYVFCLGISPNSLYFKIVSKNDCLKLTTHMTSPKKSIIKDDSYKMTITKKRMITLTMENLLKEIKEIK